MIKKELTIPMRVLHYLALLERLPQTHPQRSKVESDFARLLAGYQGEKNLRYHLSFLPENEYQIFFDLHLSVNNLEFQIDCLLLSPHLSLIIESKNIAGTLIFDTRSEQCLRIYNGKEEGFPNPILQAARHRILFLRWLKLHKFPPIPIESFVSIAFPTTIIKSANNDTSIYEKVILAESVIHKVESLKQLYKKEFIKSNQLKFLCKALLEMHSPSEFNILERLEINNKDIIKGVKCPTCPSSIMKRKYGTWFCPRCELHSKTAHEQTLLDYILLFGPNITNKQFRDFTLLSNRGTAAYLFSKSTLLPIQKGNKFLYQPPSIDWFYEDPRIKKLL
ncbi:NERD domain-containing protein [Bacillus sp. APMAM]|nr:NERD domain-containing protein [Bacillus sp. APMAM]RTZ53858.1 NERD domain-containing protein [Bacillus sp. SAJ1]